MTGGEGKITRARGTVTGVEGTLTRARGTVTGAEGTLTRAEGDEQQKPADDTEHLEEVVLEEVIHWSVRVDHPEGVEVKVDASQPRDEHHGAEFSLEAWRNSRETVDDSWYEIRRRTEGKRRPITLTDDDKNHEGEADDVEHDGADSELIVSDCDEHEYEEHSASQL